jgi:hypothetical protein
MEQYIKYKRFEKELIVGSPEYQEFLDSLIKDGWQMIYYNEQSISMFAHRVVIVGGKRQENDLKTVL